MIFRDIHEIPTAEFLQQAITGVVNGTPVTDELLFIAGIVLELFIMMVLLSRILAHRINRQINLIIGSLAIVAVLANPPGDLDDWLFSTVEIILLVAIVRTAWVWKSPTAELNPAV